MSTETETALRELAEKLGTSAEALWPKLLLAIRVDAAIWTLTGFVFLIVTYIAVPRLWKVSGKVNDSDLAGLSKAGVVCVAVTGILVGTLIIAEHAFALIVPEGLAIKLILGAVS
jgi:hypothetical protein